jgi:hypothetical protein
MIIAEMFDFKNSPAVITLGSASIAKTFPVIGEFELVKFCERE